MGTQVSWEGVLMFSDCLLSLIAFAIFVFLVIGSFIALEGCYQAFRDAIGNVRRMWTQIILLPHHNKLHSTNETAPNCGGACIQQNTQWSTTAGTHSGVG